MLSAFGWTLAGLVVLIIGSELLVRGGTRLATRLGISPTIIGLTVVALGTSAPELAVGIEAALKGSGDLAIGNIAGTNVVNILFILGLSASIQSLALRNDTLRIDLPMIVIASCALLAMTLDGELTRLDGALLIAAGVIYTMVLIQAARRESRATKLAYAAAQGEPPPPSLGSTLFDTAALLAGIAIIVVGADWLVAGAVELAKLWGVSDEFIGLTVVAIGTSSPELVTTLVSTIRRQRDIAIGNLLGSSAYNILIILGVTCVVPSSPIPVAPSLIKIDIPVMVAVALACVPVFYSGRQVSRGEGMLFVAAYLSYLGYLVIVRT
ncbi:calcium/sodium antiporter [uncultured Ferrovibrio sp.]|jgi:K+-dependent Na+/Ca+ exchanger related-protein|uniref:calcium/sodium antiporter n=1 Tax=uncultured Ferrovibrio sp. TaxID=1576913 RepID=UPI0026292831|nr:calcium/sodium antiporter [uncultured Ferrovibrio sp.]